MPLVVCVSLRSAAATELVAPSRVPATVAKTANRFDGAAIPSPISAKLATHPVQTVGAVTHTSAGRIPRLSTTESGAELSGISSMSKGAHAAAPGGIPRPDGHHYS